MLVSLEPLAVGTADCESLSSYVQRLAVIHGCTPGHLVFRLLTWLDLGQPDKIGQWQERPRRLRIGKNMNAFRHADVWLKLLQLTTKRCDLGHLTTRAWDELFPTRGFQRKTLAWCPQCLSADEVPYHRLRWLFPSVSICPKHHVFLCDQCTRCSRKLPILHERSATTICPWCGEDLRLIGSSNAGRTSEFDYWAADDIGRIVAKPRTWDSPLSWTPSGAFQRLIQSKGIEDAAEFARTIQASRTTTWSWLTGKVKPPLPVTLEVYYRFGASLADDLCGNNQGALIPTPIFQMNLPLKAPRHRRKIDWNSIKSALSAELRKPQQNAVTLDEISRRLEIESRHLRMRFPKLCYLLVQRKTRIVRANVDRRILRIKTEIAAAVDRVLATGLPVTQRNVEGQLNRPGLFCRPSTKELFRRVIVEKTSGRLSP